jgi:hypothetical protein
MLPVEFEQKYQIRNRDQEKQGLFLDGLNPVAFDLYPSNSSPRVERATQIDPLVTQWTRKTRRTAQAVPEQHEKIT